ncbi:MAG: hypothetical protein BWZ08_00577 [candidate division BRC1 bacterium ADurb.BinA292]|nr:MAG: hypothetical protein BWZ08_00577 [candidate division BRC1 bacterium ADurb.BinA292]
MPDRLGRERRIDHFLRPGGPGRQVAQHLIVGLPRQHHAGCIAAAALRRDDVREVPQRRDRQPAEPRGGAHRHQADLALIGVVFPQRPGAAIGRRRAEKIEAHHRLAVDVAHHRRAVNVGPQRVRLRQVEPLQPGLVARQRKLRVLVAQDRVRPALARGEREDQVVGRAFGLQDQPGFGPHLGAAQRHLRLRGVIVPILLAGQQDGRFGGRFRSFDAALAGLPPGGQGVGGEAEPALRHAGPRRGRGAGQNDQRQQKPPQQDALEEHR